MSQSDTSSTSSVPTVQTDFEVLDAEHLDARLTAVRDALRMCPTEVPASLSIPAHKALDAVAQRLALGVDHTVVALFGGTGSGKSSLFNALTQLNFADVGARRPTTSRAAACSWGDDAGPLLDFLGVSSERRIRRESILDAGDQGSMSGLVLLDVPDYDSVTTEHSLQVDRLVPLADILVWVVDPQKYADAALHDGYLRGLGARQEDMLVLVNQVDTLPESGLASLLDDVGSLLKDDGLSMVQVLPVSAVRGDNLDVVRSLLRQRVARESNAARTASAELDAITRRLRPTVAKNKVELNADLTEDATKVLLWRTRCEPACPRSCPGRWPALSPPRVPQWPRPTPHGFTAPRKDCRRPGRGAWSRPSSRLRPWRDRPLRLLVPFRSRDTASR